MTATTIGTHDVRWTAMARPAAVAAAAAGSLAVVALVDPNEPGHYPTCPFLALTGHACPGCGSLRALHALTHGDVVGAIARNALVVAATALLVWLWVRWIRRIWVGAPRPQPAPAAALWAGLGLVIGFWVVRDLAVGAALAP